MKIAYIVAAAVLLMAAAAVQADELTFCNYVEGQTYVLANALVSAEVTASVAFKSCTTLTYNLVTSLTLQVRAPGTTVSLSSLVYTPSSQRSNRRLFAVAKTDSSSNTEVTLTSAGTLPTAAATEVVLAFSNFGIGTGGAISAGATQGTNIDAVGNLNFRSTGTVTLTSTAQSTVTFTSSSNTELASVVLTQAVLNANVGKTIEVSLIGSASSTRSVGTYEARATDESGSNVGSSSTTSPAATLAPSVSLVLALVCAVALALASF